MARTQEKTQPKKQQDRQKSGSGSRRTSSRRQPQRKSAKSQNAVIRYFQETRDELRKVTWPTQDQTIRLSLIVLGTTLAFTIVLGLLDYLFLFLESLLL